MNRSRMKTLFEVKRQDGDMKQTGMSEEDEKQR